MGSLFVFLELITKVNGFELFLGYVNVLALRLPDF